MTPQPHVVPVRVYAVIFAVLLGLTAITTAVAFVDLGRLNVLIMLGIALTKATLVVLYFMHVRYGTRLTWLVVATGFGFLGLLVVTTTGDMLVRVLIPQPLSPLAHPPAAAFQNAPQP
jgi:cytochrome c oxidase subunit 4